MYPSSSYHLSPPGSPPSSSSSSSTSSEENARQERRRQKRVATYEAVRYMVNYMANNVIPLILVNYMSNNKERTYIERNREEGHARLFNDYFSENPVYPPQMFRRRFRMRKHLFLRIVEGVGAYDSHFQHKPDATGRLSLSPLIKCTKTLRLLAYGEAADRVDEYLRLGESTARKVLVRFLEAVIHQFGDEYLRRPTVQDLQRLLQVGAYRGFPGMLNKVMTTCIILHNMIVEDERDTYANYADYSEYENLHSQVQEAEYGAGYQIEIDRYIVNRDNLRSRNTHKALKKKLIEHIWQRFGDGN
ncbi:uncharacterized protein LOC141632586 [Silene latifolia]|uniref:uncharacterized protein LOC141632586 n=1 Tax=Silene latifolia TaxID=37657 RepID=UPI003D788DC6